MESSTKQRKKTDTSTDDRITNAEMNQALKEFKAQYDKDAGEFLKRISDVETNVGTLQMADKSDAPDSLKNRVNSVESDLRVMDADFTQVRYEFNAIKAENTALKNRASELETRISQIETLIHG